MSWGERSCKRPKEKKGCPIDDQNYGNCDVDCPEYIWDGETPPDSVPRPAVRADRVREHKEYLMRKPTRRNLTRNQRKRARKKHR